MRSLGLEILGWGVVRALGWVGLGAEVVDAKP